MEKEKSDQAVRKAKIYAAYGRSEQVFESPEEVNQSIDKSKLDVESLRRKKTRSSRGMTDSEKITVFCCVMTMLTLRIFVPAESFWGYLPIVGLGIVTLSYALFCIFFRR